MAPRTKLAAAGTLAAATLLLTACGGGDPEDRIASVPRPAVPTATRGVPAAAPTADPGAPVFDFPSDVKVIVDADPTGDPTKDAILRDQGYGLDATYAAVARLDMRLPSFSEYVSEDAAETWSRAIESGKADSTTLTGEIHFFDRRVTVGNGTTAAVTFCEDQRRGYDKDVRTGKVDTSTPSADSFVFHTSLMRKTHGIWRTATYNSQRGAARCQP